VDQVEQSERNLLKLFGEGIKGKIEAMKEFKDALALLRKRRENQATRDGRSDLETRNKMLLNVEAKLLQDLQGSMQQHKQAKKM